MNDPTRDIWRSRVLEPVLYKDRLSNWERNTYAIPGPRLGLNGGIRDMADHYPAPFYPVDLRDVLGPSYYKSIFARIGSRQPETTIGGLCIVYSGDLQYIMKGTLPGGAKIGNVRDIARWCEKLPRIDQIVDAVGPTSSGNYLCVFEDSLFGQMIGARLNLDQPELTKIFRGVSERSADKIQRWLSIATGKAARFIPAYTSDFDGLLAEYVVRLASEMNDPRFAEVEKSKVAMMYTYFWPALLKEAGYLGSEDVLCCEPFQHFIEMALASSQGSYGIDGFAGVEAFFRKNPWGKRKNRSFGAAGFIPSISLASQDFSRQEICSNVISNENPGRAFSNYVRRGLGQPFPLSQNPIFRDSANLLFPFEEARKLAIFASELERQYKMAKKGHENAADMIGDAANVSRWKFKFSADMSGVLADLAYRLEDIYKKLEFG